MTLNRLDAHICRRLRALELRQCKRKRTIVRKLIELGIKAKTAWRTVYAGRKSWWALSHTYAVERALNNCLWEERGLKTLAHRYWAHPERMVASMPEQYTLAWG